MIMCSQFQSVLMGISGSKVFVPNITNQAFRKALQMKRNVLISSCQSQHTFVHSFDKSSSTPSPPQMHLYFINQVQGEIILMLLPMETKRQTSELSISHKIMNVWTKEKSLRNHVMLDIWMILRRLFSQMQRSNHT